MIANESRTAFFAHSVELVAKMATVLGRREEAARYGELFRRIKDAFNAAYVKADGRIEGDTQAGYALALRFDLLPRDLPGRKHRPPSGGFVPVAWVGVAADSIPGPRSEWPSSPRRSAAPGETWDR